MIIPEEIYQGERVKYFPTGAGNVSEGVVKRILTEPQPVGTRSNVPASEEDPRIVDLIYWFFYCHT